MPYIFPPNSRSTALSGCQPNLAKNDIIQGSQCPVWLVPVRGLAKPAKPRPAKQRLWNAFVLIMRNGARAPNVKSGNQIEPSLSKQKLFSFIQHRLTATAKNKSLTPSGGGVPFFHSAPINMAAPAALFCYLAGKCHGRAPSTENSIPKDRMLFFSLVPITLATSSAFSLLRSPQMPGQELLKLLKC